MVFREVRELDSNEQSSNVTAGRRLRSVIFIVIESGIALLAIQIAWFVLTVVRTEPSCLPIFIGIHQMFNVIIRPVTATCYFC